MFTKLRESFDAGGTFRVWVLMLTLIASVFVMGLLPRGWQRYVAPAAWSIYYAFRFRRWLDSASKPNADDHASSNRSITLSDSIDS